MKMIDVIFHNFWLKLISLVLAVSTWFYVFDLVNSESFSQKKETLEDIFTRYNFVVKDVPVKPIYTGKSPEGYYIPFDDVIIKPAKISIFGPEDVVENVEELKTERIDIGEYTRSTSISFGVYSNVKPLKFKEKTVQVFLPVFPTRSEEKAK